MEFVGQFRQTSKNSPDGFTDSVKLLSAMPQLRNRLHLYRLFRLSCICLTEDTHLLPPVRFQDVDSQSPRCRLDDVLLLAESYLARVPDSIPVCTNETSLPNFRELEDHFNSGNVAGDP